ncbi:MAG: DinB family protein [Terrimesophilobacter sp.]
MSAGTELLVDGFSRVRGAVRRVARGLTPHDLSVRVDDGANSIGWLIWHLTRVQDDHVADIADTDQVWTDSGWFERFGLPFPAEVTGFGQSTNEVAQVAGITAELLIGYHEAVHDRTVQFIRELSDADFERVVDTGWDPPVTLGVRLVSVIADDLQHVGQAAFVAGMLARR